MAQSTPVPFFDVDRCRSLATWLARNNSSLFRQTNQDAHPSTTLLDPAIYSGMFSQMVTTLYRLGEFGTLARGDRSHGDRARSAPDSLARTVSTLLRPSGAAARPADVRAGCVQRQRSQIGVATD